MSAASSGSADPALSAAELAVLRALDGGPVFQPLAELAIAAGVSPPAAAAAMRRLYYRFGYATPADPRAHGALDTQPWACTTLGQARLARELEGLF